MTGWWMRTLVPPTLAAHVPPPPPTTWPAALLQCSYNQATYTSHPWRLRDAASGDLLAE